MDEDGFYIGEANGMRGLVPSNFLADAGPVDQTTNVRHVSRVKGGGAEQSLEIGFSNQIFFPQNFKNFYLYRRINLVFRY